MLYEKFLKENDEERKIIGNIQTKMSGNEMEKNYGKENLGTRRKYLKILRKLLRLYPRKKYLKLNQQIWGKYVCSKKVK